MALTQNQFSLNTLQWITVALSEGTDEPDDLGWEFNRPSFLAKQPKIFEQVMEAGFGMAMMEVLPTQTLQAFKKVVDDTGIVLSPGYVQVGLPEDSGLDLTPGSDSEFRWLDSIRRRAEESLYMGMDRIFLAADMAPGRPRIDVAAAVGYEFDAARLDRITYFIGKAAEVLVAEGVKPSLHNHVGAWVETEAEFDHVLDAISPDLLALGPDLGHLAWTGVDIVEWMKKHTARIADMHIKDLDEAKAAATRAEHTPYFAATGNRLFQEPGLGDLPLVEALGHLPDSFDGTILVEVDVPTMEPFASAKTSWKWVVENFPSA